MKKQRGATLVGMLFIAGLVVAGAILAAKLVPAYLEFMSVKKILNAMATSGDLKTMSPKELRASFEKRADIDNIRSVKQDDLIIERAGNEATVSVDYAVKVPIAANISACLDFSASTQAKGE
ncbi:MAG: DUF4845 domain-containing protein [Sulfuricella sp.]|nr:DUF4845 domain-containing protein [Gammaproteobacteria bacterium]